MDAAGDRAAPAAVRHEVESLARIGGAVGLPRTFVAAVEWPGPAVRRRIDPALVVTSGFPAGWASAQGGRAWYADDFVYRAAMGTTLPIRWTCRAEGGQAAGLQLSPSERGYAAALDRSGLRSGVTIPVHLPGTRLLAVTLACPHPDLPDRARAAVDALFVQAHAAAARLAGVLPRLRRGEHTLTSREVDCLALAARGLTDAGIADRLGCATGTVGVHVKRARTKLGARTRAHAVALALASGVIDDLPH